MTDLTPNDLSHLSDEEFNALCPQGEHAPGPEPLSPAAQAVWDAAWADTPVICGDTEGTRKCQIAAALRAAAEHCYFIDDDGCEMVSVLQLLAIAAELEGQ